MNFTFKDLIYYISIVVLATFLWFMLIGCVSVGPADISSERVRIYDEKGKYKGHVIKDSWSTRIYDSKGKYKGTIK